MLFVDRDEAFDVAVCSMRAVGQAALLAANMCLWVLTAAGGSPRAAPSTVDLPPDFTPRFMSICKARGLSEPRCTCMSAIALREVADRNLTLMLDYFENPSGFDSRALEELDNDEARLAELEGEIAAVQAATRAECAAR